MGYKRIIGFTMGAVLLTGSICAFGSGTEAGFTPLDIRETAGARWMLPPKIEQQQPAADWKVVYPITAVQAFKEPSITSAPVFVLPFKVAVKPLERVDDDKGNPQWLKVKAGDGSASVGWIEARHVAASLTGFISKTYEGVDYGPIQKAKGYPGNPRVKVKGLYVTINTAASPALENLIRLADETEINGFVIDVKDDYGRMLFPTKAASLFCPEANQGATVKDIKGLMARLKEKNIYTIARIVTFKTPNYALKHPERAVYDKGTGQVYQSRDGLHWASAYDRVLWRYNVEVAKEAAEAGFNEIQFDYVRFPDVRGDVEARLDYKNSWGESKTLAVHRFLQFARAQLEPYRVYVAADTFGWTASSLGDENIGQHWESLSNVVDYNCPMIYPSHYGPGNFGIPVPDAAPYDTINRGIADALRRDANLETPAVLRPWIQDFTAKWVKGYIPYGPIEVRAQIQALEDNGIEEFLIWNAANRYTEGALKPE